VASCRSACSIRGRSGTLGLAARHPDLPLETAGGGTRIAELMRAARGVLLDLSPDFEVAGAVAGRAGPVSVVIARSVAQPAPAAALLIRPDGYVAWAHRYQPRVQERLLFAVMQTRARWPLPSGYRGP
jgi:hypothetical protein